MVALASAAFVLISPTHSFQRVFTNHPMLVANQQKKRGLLTTLKAATGSYVLPASNEGNVILVHLQVMMRMRGIMSKGQTTTVLLKMVAI